MYRYLQLVWYLTSKMITLHHNADLPFSQACENNKQPILAVLQQAFAHCKHILEVGSGTGQHAVHFAASLPHLHWQASDQAIYLPDLTQRIKRSAIANLALPVLFDVTQEPAFITTFDGIYTANTLHIMPWPVVQQFFMHLNMLCTPDAVLCIYGPFKYEGRFTSDSNQAFDLSLKQRDATMGIRDIEQVVALAQQQGFLLVNDFAMPANNQLLQFHRSL